MDSHEQIRNLEQKIDQNKNPDAHLELGLILIRGPVEVRDLEKGLKHIKIAADAGLADAQFWFGRYFQIDSGVKQDLVLSAQYLWQAVQQGHGCACLALGILYNDAEVSQDLALDLFRQAKSLLEQKALENDAYAINMLAIMYEWGYGVDKNVKYACELFEKAAALGEVEAITRLARIYYKGKAGAQNFAKAFELLSKASDLGDVAAINNLASMYAEGEGVEKNLNKALELFQKAADLRNAKAYFALASFYASGVGVKQDLSLARSLYLKAAECGYAAAFKNIACMYRNGDSCPKDEHKALEFFMLAAEDPYGFKFIVDQAQQSTTPLSLTVAGCALFKKANFIEAFQLLKNSKHANWPEIGFCLGVSYMFGFAGVQDIKQGQGYLRAAADRDYKPALELMLVNYNHRYIDVGSLENDSDIQSTLSASENSAKHHGVYGNTVLGIAKLQGLGLSQSLTSSLSYFKQATQDKGALANFILGLIALDEFADGTAVDLELAKKHLHMAKLLTSLNENALLNDASQLYVSNSVIDVWLTHIQMLELDVASDTNSVEDVLIKDMHQHFADMFVLALNFKKINVEFVLNGYLMGLLYLKQADQIADGIKILEFIVDYADNLVDIDYSSAGQSGVSLSNAPLFLRSIKEAAALKLGLFYEQNTDIDKALAYFKQAASLESNGPLSYVKYPCFDIFQTYQLKALRKLCLILGRGSLHVSAENLSYYELATSKQLVDFMLPLGSYFKDRDLNKAVKAYKVAANAGVAQAQFELALIYQQEPQFKSQATAIELFKAAMKSGVMDAALYLGKIYEEGLGCTVNLTLAFDFYLKAANAGNSEAKFKVGQIYLEGTGTEQSAQKALSWLELAATDKHAQATFELAKLYEEGQHVVQNIERAKELYQQALDLGSAEAGLALTKLQLSTSGGQNQQELVQQLIKGGDITTAIEVYQQQLKQKESCIDNQEAKDNKETDEQVAWALDGLKTLADEGLLKAQVALALYFAKLQGSSNQEQAYTYHVLAAEQGHIPSYVKLAQRDFARQAYEEAFARLNQIMDVAKISVNHVPTGYENEDHELWQNDLSEMHFMLAQCYDQGLGTEVDSKKAKELYAKPAEAGNNEARLAIAMLYLKGGNNLKPDERQAVTLLNKLVKRKYAPAQYELGLLYLLGQGVKADKKQALDLIKAAAAKKYPAAIAKLKEI